MDLGGRDFFQRWKWGGKNFFTKSDWGGGLDFFHGSKWGAKTFFDRKIMVFPGGLPVNFGHSLTGIVRQGPDPLPALLADIH